MKLLPNCTSWDGYVLYPDLNVFQKWQLKAKELSGIATLKISDLLELNANEQEKKQGLDLGDFLIEQINK